MDRFTFDSLPFGQLVRVKPFTNANAKDNFYGEDPPTFEELVELHDTARQNAIVGQYNRKPRTRWSISGQDFLKRERYVNGTLSTIEYLPFDQIHPWAGHTTPWGQNISVESFQNQTIRIDFNDGHASKLFKSPVVFYHDVIPVNSLISDGKVAIDRYSRDNVKDGHNAIATHITPTQWEKHWLTVELVVTSHAISKLQLRVKSSLFDEPYIDCCDFTCPSGQKVVMIDMSGDCPHGINAIESIKVGKEVFDAPIGKPLFFWYYTERGQHATTAAVEWRFTAENGRIIGVDSDDMELPRKQALQQQPKSPPKPPSNPEWARISNGFKKTYDSGLRPYPKGQTHPTAIHPVTKKPRTDWMRLNGAAFDELYNMYETWVPCYRPEQLDKDGEPAFPIIKRDSNGRAMRKGLVLDKSGNYYYRVKYMRESYDFVDQQEETRYQRMLDKLNPDIETNIADVFVYDEIEQEEYAKQLEGQDVHTFASDTFEIGAGGTVYEKHENHSVRLDPEDADMMNVQYLQRALDVTHERAAEIQAQLDVLIGQDNTEKQKWIERLRGQQGADMSQDEAYRWLKECSDALLELEADTEEIQVSSTSDFTQSDITITVGTSTDSRIDPAEEKDQAIRDISEMLDDRSGNPALATGHIERYSDLTKEKKELMANVNRETPLPTIKVHAKDVEETRLLDFSTNPDEDMLYIKHVQAAVKAKAAPAKNAMARLVQQDAKTRAYAWERGFENRNERAAILETCPDVVAGIKMVNAVIKHGLNKPDMHPVIGAIEAVRDAVDRHRLLGTLFGGVTAPAPPRPDRDWTPPAEDVHIAEREQQIERVLAESTCLTPFEKAKSDWFKTANKRDKTFKFVARIKYAQSNPPTTDPVKVISHELEYVTEPTIITEPVYHWYGAIEGRSLEPGERIPVDKNHPWEIDLNPYACIPGIKAGRAWIWRRVLKRVKVGERTYTAYRTIAKPKAITRYISKPSPIISNQPFIDVPASPSYAYHKIESIRAESPYTQIVEVHKKVWDFENLSRNGKPTPMWLYRIYPRLIGGDGTMLKTRRQQVETRLAWFHKDAPPPPPKKGVHNGGEEFLNGTNKKFDYSNHQWMM